MTLNMNDSQLNTLNDIDNFINSTNAISFKKLSKKESYAWIEEVLVILEDRDRVVEEWRNLGFNCWQVRAGGY